MATRLDIIPRIVTKLGLPSTDGMITTTVLEQCLNDGIEKMSTEHSWPWLKADGTITTTAGTTEYSPPARWIKTLMLGYLDTELSVVQRREIIDWSMTIGAPRVFSVHKQMIVIAPTPDQSYDLFHSYVVPENRLDDDTTTVLCPDWYLDVLVTYAAIEACRRMKDDSLLADLMAAKKEWQSIIELNEPQSSVLPRVRSRWGSGGGGGGVFP